jgi:hypothetical protein
VSEAIEEARRLCATEGADPLDLAEYVPELLAEVDRLNTAAKLLADQNRRYDRWRIDAINEREEVVEERDDANAEIRRLTADLGHVEPEEEPMHGVAVEGERCESCGRMIAVDDAVAVFYEDDGREVAMHWGPCPEPDLVIRKIVSRRLSEPCEVEAHVLGVWGAHPDPDGPTRILAEPWIVTHVSTGQHVLVTPLRREEAIALVERLGLMRPMGPRDLDVVIVASDVLNG